jgi:hypothetical protein
VTVTGQILTLVTANQEIRLAGPCQGGRHDAATGHCGIIDWSSAEHGPLLYDLASAVMYLGGPLTT